MNTERGKGVGSENRIFSIESLFPLEVTIAKKLELHKSTEIETNLFFEFLFKYTRYITFINSDSIKNNQNINYFLSLLSSFSRRERSFEVFFIHL